MKNPALLEELIGSQASKNYKGIMINHITNMTIKWTTIIVPIYLMNSSKTFDVKQDMLEMIKNIAFDIKHYNWEMHVASLIKINSEICQELKGSI